MTQAQFETACGATLILLKRHGDFDAMRDTDYPTSIWHLSWMLVQACLFYAEQRQEKANRWLGYVQGVMSALEYASLEELKIANKPEGEAFDPGKI